MSESAPVSVVDKEHFACRMYKNRYPEIDELVMVNVRQIAEMGAYVNLLEYNNVEGMVLLSELSRRRIRSVQKLIRVGRNEVVVVLRVDKDKGYIDLSKRRVSAEEIQKCEERYNKSKTVHTIIRYIAEKNEIPTEEIYEKYIWPLYDQYGHAYDAFKLAITEPEKVFVNLQEMPEQLKKDLLANINRRLMPQKAKIRADVEVYCYAEAGIDAIKEALTAGEAVSTSDVNIKVKLVAPPLYVVMTHCYDKVQGIALMEAALAEIEKSIVAAGGSFVVRMKPKAVSDTDEMELDALMKRAEMENAEISGDEDDSDNDE